MPDQFAESWEYYTPDPEIAELFAEAGAVAVPTVSDVLYGGTDGRGERMRQAGTGYRDTGRHCETCGAWFHPYMNSTRKLFCSIRCAGVAARVEDHPTGCPGCGGPIPVQTKKGKPPFKFCSEACRNRVGSRRYRRAKSAKSRTAGAG